MPRLRTSTGHRACVHQKPVIADFHYSPHTMNISRNLLPARDCINMHWQAENPPLSWLQARFRRTGRSMSVPVHQCIFHSRPHGPVQFKSITCIYDNNRCSEIRESSSCPQGPVPELHDTHQRPAPGWLLCASFSRPRHRREIRSGHLDLPRRG
jgi:hypothetical protein